MEAVLPELWAQLEVAQSSGSTADEKAWRLRSLIRASALESRSQYSAQRRAAAAIVEAYSLAPRPKVADEVQTAARFGVANKAAAVLPERYAAIARRSMAAVDDYKRALSKEFEALTSDLSALPQRLRPQPPAAPRPEYQRPVSPPRASEMSEPAARQQREAPSVAANAISRAVFKGQQQRAAGHRAVKEDVEMADADDDLPKCDFVTAAEKFVRPLTHRRAPQRLTDSARAVQAEDERNREQQGGGGQQPQRPKTLGGKRKFVPPLRRDSPGNEPQRKMARTGADQRSRGGGAEGDSGAAGLTEVNGVPLDDPRLRNIEPELLERVLNEIFDSSTVKWDDIAGLSFAKSCVHEAVVWPMLRPDIFTGLRGPPKGLLLFGPPGTGKTMIGKAIACESQSTFFNISASTLTSKWIGEGEKTVRALFAVARCFARSVVFIDEIDSILTQRSESENEASRRLKTEFLVQLDGAGVGDKDQILVVGATNRPQELDEAARRRLVKRLYIPLPDRPARIVLVRQLLRSVPQDITEAQLEEIADKTDGYSGSDIKALCQDAAVGPVRAVQQAGIDISTVDAAMLRPVNLADFDEALSHVRASVSHADLLHFVEWNSRFGSYPMQQLEPTAS